MTDAVNIEALALYRPEVRVRVGILLIGGALASEQDAVEHALLTAGHTALRRRAILQTRSGEAELRFGDVMEYLELYGHEYALVVARPFSDCEGREEAIADAAQRAGCHFEWEPSPRTPDVSA